MLDSDLPIDRSWQRAGFNFLPRPRIIPVHSRGWIFSCTVIDHGDFEVRARKCWNIGSIDESVHSSGLNTSGRNWRGSWEIFTHNYFVPFRISTCVIDSACY